jgi:hypothetical protein
MRLSRRSTGECRAWHRIMIFFGGLVVPGEKLLDYPGGPLVFWISCDAKGCGGLRDRAASAFGLQGGSIASKVSAGCPTRAMQLRLSSPSKTCSCRCVVVVSWCWRDEGRGAAIFTASRPRDRSGRGTPSQDQMQRLELQHAYASISISGFCIKEKMQCSVSHRARVQDVVHESGVNATRTSRHAPSPLCVAKTHGAAAPQGICACTLHVSAFARNQGCWPSHHQCTH